MTEYWWLKDTSWLEIDLKLAEKMTQDLLSWNKYLENLLMETYHWDFRAWNIDENHLPTEEKCTIMWSEPSNVNNLADGYSLKFYSHFPEVGRTM